VLGLSGGEDFILDENAMFQNDPWQSGFGRRRLWGMPVLLIVAIAAGWFLINGPLALELGRFFLDDDGNTTLDLPDELVLARLPVSYSWGPDPTSDGVLIALPNEGNPAWQIDVLEHWTRPWRESKREPIPDAWRAATQPDWQNDTALVCHFGLSSPVSRDRRFLAATHHPAERVAYTSILALPGGQEVARLEAVSSGANGKCIAWHPTDNVLIIGGNDKITLAAGSDWKPRTLATAARDKQEWEKRVRTGHEESGYHTNENVSQLIFSEDGALLIVAMDRGVRVYDWKEVRAADTQLPAPRHAVEGVLIPRPLVSFKMTFSVAYDARRRLVLWSENDGKLKYLDLGTGKQATLLALSNRYCLSRLHLCVAGDALICEIVRLGKSQNGLSTLAVLDYPQLLERAGIARDGAAPGPVKNE
jgi:hypothetical protein